MSEALREEKSRILIEPEFLENVAHHIPWGWGKGAGQSGL